jgi:hypothetical protein
MNCQCPKCGGTSGFSYDLVIRTHRIGSWNENDDEEVDICTVVKFPATVVCVDCGKRVKWDVAHKTTKTPILN